MTVINNILKALRDIDAEFYVDVVKIPLNNVELPFHALQKNFNEYRLLNNGTINPR
jgi:hypothetical protein